MHTTPGIHATQSIQDDVYTQWVKDPEGFWAEAGEAIHWYQRWNRVLDGSRPPFYRWFPGAEVNTCYNALDWHVEHGRADQPALIYDSPVTGTIKHFTYRELRDEVARFAGALAGLGVGKGDRVIIYMPMVPEAVVAMLACARIGAIHSVVFGGFASHELAARISHARPNVIVSASCGIEVNRIVPYKPLLDKAIELAEVKPRRCIILQRPQQQAPMIPGRDVDWAELTAAAQPAACVPVAATDPLYILYTSAPRPSRGPTRPSRLRTSMGSSPAKSTGPRRTSAGPWGTRISSTVRCSMGTPQCSTRASPSARPIPAHSGASSRSTG